VVAVFLLAFWQHYAEMRVLSGLTLRRIGFAFAAGVVVFLLWINLDFEWAQVGKLPSFDPTHADRPEIHWTLVSFRVIGLAVVVPVMEELFWRSFLLRWLDRHDFLAQDPARVSLRATIICALLFASEHNLWVAGLLAGLIYNFVYMRGGNLWLPIVSHATTNAALAWWILATGHWEFW
jgi:CAAX prenyl protease-like protein